MGALPAARSGVCTFYSLQFALKKPAYLDSPGIESQRFWTKHTMKMIISSFRKDKNCLPFPKRFPENLALDSIFCFATRVAGDVRVNTPWNWSKTFTSWNLNLCRKTDATQMSREGLNWIWIIQGDEIARLMFRFRDQLRLLHPSRKVKLLPRLVKLVSQTRCTTRGKTRAFSLNVIMIIHKGR